MSCLINKVGLTRVQCNCFDGDLPEDYDRVNASESGYYLTDTGDGFPLLEAIYQSASCGDGSIYDILKSCRAQAVNEVYTNLGAAISMRYDSGIGFNENIGRTNRSTTIGNTNRYNGMQIRARRIKGASIVLKAFNLGFSITTASVNIVIRSSVGDILFPPKVIPVTTIAGQFVRYALSQKIELPCYYSGHTEPISYFIYYDAAGQIPFANNFACCSYKPSYNKLFNVNGFTVTDIERIVATEDFKATDSRAFGLSIESASSCNAMEWLCDIGELDGLSYANVLAKAIQLRGAAFLAQYVLDSPNMNLFTMSRRENVYGKRNHAISEFNKRIDWLSQNIPNGATECLGCKKTKVQISRGSLK